MAVRYILTVNSNNEEELKQVLEELDKCNMMHRVLEVDECFGPSPFDGSFITMLSSDSLTDFGYLAGKPMTRKTANTMFLNIVRKVPGARFTLKAKTPPGESGGFVKAWNRRYYNRDRSLIALGEQ